jgi:hypothetical protein
MPTTRHGIHFHALDILRSPNGRKHISYLALIEKMRMSSQVLDMLAEQTVICLCHMRSSWTKRFVGKRARSFSISYDPTKMQAASSGA